MPSALLYMHGGRFSVSVLVAFRLSALTFSAVRAISGAFAPWLVPLTFSPSFCRCLPVVGRCQWLCRCLKRCSRCSRFGGALALAPPFRYCGACWGCRPSFRVWLWFPFWVVALRSLSAVYDGFLFSAYSLCTLGAVG